MVLSKACSKPYSKHSAKQTKTKAIIINKCVRLNKWFSFKQNKTKGNLTKTHSTLLRCHARDFIQSHLRNFYTCIHTQRKKICVAMLFANRSRAAVCLDCRVNVWVCVCVRTLNLWQLHSAIARSKFFFLHFTLLLFIFFESNIHSSLLLLLLLWNLVILYFSVNGVDFKFYFFFFLPFSLSLSLPFSFLICMEKIYIHSKPTRIGFCKREDKKTTS